MRLIGIYQAQRASGKYIWLSMHISAPDTDEGRDKLKKRYDSQIKDKFCKNFQIVKIKEK